MLNFLFKMIVRILPIVGVLLLIPLIAMELTDEVTWPFFDFMIMGALLTITGLLIGVILKKIKYHKYREAFIVIIVMIRENFRVSILKEFQMVSLFIILRMEQK